MNEQPKRDSSHSNLTHLSSEGLFERMQALKAKGANKNVDIPLATAIVLLEVASSDHIVDRFEKAVIHNGLKSIFRLSDQSVSGLLARAKSSLSSMRSSSTDASVLKELLDPGTKRAVANLMDSLIRCNGVVDSMEVYLRQRFRALLGLPEEPLPPRSEE